MYFFSPQFSILMSEAVYRCYMDFCVSSVFCFVFFLYCVIATGIINNKATFR